MSSKYRGMPEGWHPPMAIPRMHDNQDLYESLGREGNRSRQQDTERRAAEREDRLDLYRDSLEQEAKTRLQREMKRIQLEKQFMEEAEESLTPEEIERYKEEMRRQGGAALNEEEKNRIEQHRMEQIRRDARETLKEMGYPDGTYIPRDGEDED